MELQTANEYRHMVIMNDSKIYKELYRHFKTGNLVGFFRAANTYLHSLDVPWDACQQIGNSGSAPKDHNRWLPLVHWLLMDFAEMIELPDDGTRAAVDKHKTLTEEDPMGTATLLTTYKTGTPLEFLRLFNLSHGPSCRDIQEGPGYLHLALRIMDKLYALARASNTIKSSSPAAHYKDSFPPLPTTKQEYYNMKPTIIEDLTYIDNDLASTMSDEKIFLKIADLETEATRLAKIKTKSAKITKRIRALRKSAKKLAAYVDGR